MASCLSTYIPLSISEASASIYGFDKVTLLRVFSTILTVSEFYFLYIFGIPGGHQGRGRRRYPGYFTLIHKSRACTGTCLPHLGTTSFPLEDRPLSTSRSARGGFY